MQKRMGLVVCGVLLLLALILVFIYRAVSRPSVSPSVRQVVSSDVQGKGADTLPTTYADLRGVKWRGDVGGVDGVDVGLFKKWDSPVSGIVRSVFAELYIDNSICFIVEVEVDNLRYFLNVTPEQSKVSVGKVVACDAYYMPTEGAVISVLFPAW